MPSPWLVTAAPGSQGPLTEGVMADLIFVASTTAFFAVALAYAAGCDRL